VANQITDAVYGRRAALVAMGTVGLVTAAGCASYGDKSADTPAPAPAAAGGGGAELGASSEIPVGGGKVFANNEVVVTQPVKGTFAAFSAICPHQGCAVDTVKDGTINCPCHGSKFKVADGSVAKGPATTGLAKKSVTVTGDKITLA
jgi:Rieske Fe-S protein